MKQKDPEINVFMRKNSIYLALAVIIVLGAWWQAERSKIEVDYSQSGAATFGGEAYLEGGGCLYDCEVKKQSCLKKAFTSKKRAACEKNYNSCKNSCSTTGQLETANEALLETANKALQAVALKPGLFESVIAEATRLGLRVEREAGANSAIIVYPQTGEKLAYLFTEEGTPTAYAEGHIAGRYSTCALEGFPGVRVICFPDGRIVGIRSTNYNTDVSCGSEASDANCQKFQTAVQGALNDWNSVPSIPKSNPPGTLNINDDLVVIRIVPQSQFGPVVPDSSPPIGDASCSQFMRSFSWDDVVTICEIRVNENYLASITDARLRHTIRHELGHGFGLNHKDGALPGENTMSTYTPLTGSGPTGISPDAAQAVAKIMQAAQNGTKLKVSSCVSCKFGYDGQNIQCKSADTVCPEGQVAINGKCEVKPICYPPLVYSPSTNACAYQNQDILGDNCTYQFGPGGEYYRTCSLLGGAKEVCYREAYGIAEKCVYVPGSSGGSFGGGGDLFQLDFQGGAGFFDYLKTIETCTQNPSQPGCDSF